MKVISRRSKMLSRLSPCASSLRLPLSEKSLKPVVALKNAKKRSKIAQIAAITTEQGVTIQIISQVSSNRQRHLSTILSSPTTQPMRQILQLTRSENKSLSFDSGSKMLSKKKKWLAQILIPCKPTPVQIEKTFSRFN